MTGLSLGKRPYRHISLLLHNRVEHSGFYLISKPKRSNQVSVHPIPAYLREPKPDKAEQGPSGKAAEPQASALTPPIADQQEQLQIYKLGAGKVVGELRMSTHVGKSVALSTRISSGGVELEVSQVNGSSNDILQIANLPDFAISSATIVQIKLPESKGDSAKLVLHGEYDPDELDDYFPVVIERDPSFINRQRNPLPGREENPASQRRIIEVHEDSSLDAATGGRERDDDGQDDATSNESSCSEDDRGKRRKI